MKPAALEARKLQAMERIEKSVDALIGSRGLNFVDATVAPSRLAEVRSLITLERIERKLAFLESAVPSAPAVEAVVIEAVDEPASEKPSKKKK